MRQKKPKNKSLATMTDGCCSPERPDSGSGEEACVNTSDHSAPTPTQKLTGGSRNKQGLVLVSYLVVSEATAAPVWCTHVRGCGGAGWVEVEGVASRQ